MLQVIIADVGDKDSTYDDFLSVLPPSDCRYGGMHTYFLQGLHISGMPLSRPRFLIIG